ncbi:MAG: dTDP-4-dehydrorhamnose reductase [candidate division Zixibacteria bacterium]|nr:dTDP-4-dehydrorhamnose reductase [candidate division Zixibacteria bacterium]
MAASGRILITGHRGQLGSDLITLLGADRPVSGVDLPEVDITDLNQVLSTVRRLRPDVVIHAAACTDVDGCETDSETAFSVNRDGTWNVAQACAELGTRLIYYSTDYVFDGTKPTPYVETDQPNPRSVYGRSKLAGEKAVRELIDDHAILRVAWVYGLQGKNFVRTIIRLGKQQLAERESDGPVSPLRIVTDQIGNPTWTEEIVRQTSKVLDHDLRGTFHATSEGEASWYEFARQVFEILKMDVDIQPCTTAEFSRPAPRPARSSLENARLKEVGCNVMRDYRIALEEFLERHGPELTI